MNENERARTYEDIERDIFALLSENTNDYGRFKTERKRVNSEEILNLNRELQQRFNISASIEYLYFILDYYSDDIDKKQNLKRVYRFLRALNLSIEDLNTRAIYTTYRKLVAYRTQDGDSEDEQEDLNDFLDFARAFKIAHSKKTIHLI